MSLGENKNKSKEKIPQLVVFRPIWGIFEFCEGESSQETPLVKLLRPCHKLPSCITHDVF